MNYLEQADQDLRDAEEADKKRQLIAGIGQALAAAASARGLARVGKSPDLSQFDNISSASSRAVADAVASRRAAREIQQAADAETAKKKEEAIADAAKLKQEREIADQKNLGETAKASAAAAQKAEELDLKRQELKQDKEISGAKLKAEATKPAEVKLSPQETSRQRVVGEEVGNYQTRGGRKTVEASLAKLENIAKTLEKSKNSRLTGTVVDKAAAILGAEDLRDTLSPDQLALKQQVKDAVLPGLKAMFPGATSDTELKTFMELTWDDRLEPKENAVKIRARLPQLMSRMESLEALSGGSAPSVESSSNPYPKTVRKGNQSATVSNESEEKEARAEGWQ